MRLHWLSLFVILLSAGCASSSTPYETPADKAFEIPVALADQFSVKDEKVAPIAAPPPPTLAAPVKGKKGKKSVKPAVAKKAAKDLARDTAAAAAREAALWPNRWGIEPFFLTGEKYVFDVTYFGATAGELEMEIMPPKVVANRNVFHIRATARTASVFTLFYRMNDVAESFMDTETLVSHKFSLKLDESLQQRDVLELYDHRQKKVHYWSKLDHKKKGKKEEQFEIDILPFTQDGVSAFFYLRTLPLKMGDVYTFPVVTNGKMREVRVTVVRKERIKTKIGEIDTIVVKPEVVLDGVIKTSGDSFVWISDDPQRVLLKVDAKIKIGSVIAYLKEHSYGGAQPAAR